MINEKVQAREKRKWVKSEEKRIIQKGKGKEKKDTRKALKRDKMPDNKWKKEKE